MKINDLKPGLELGPSEWLVIDQARIDAFADATGDHQWIHVDPVRATQGPFRTTIGHGYLTLSLLVPFSYELLPIDCGMTVNYGLDRVRFPAPLPVDSRIRARFRIEDVTEVEGGAQVKIAGTIEREGQTKPVCVAELLFRYYL